MTLSDYLAQPDRSASQLAAHTGSAVSTITRAADGKTIPSRELMVKIFEATGGAVTPNDFYLEADTASETDDAQGNVDKFSTDMDQQLGEAA